MPLRNKMKKASLLRYKKRHNVDAGKTTISKALEKSNSIKIAGWFNSQFKRISSETLTRKVIVL
jgi:hypothetical protein